MSIGMSLMASGFLNLEVGKFMMPSLRCMTKRKKKQIKLFENYLLSLMKDWNECESCVVPPIIHWHCEIVSMLQGIFRLHSVLFELKILKKCCNKHDRV